MVNALLIPQMYAERPIAASPQPDLLDVSVAPNYAIPIFRVFID
ncbi:hypothetical protein CEV32_2616 [Brucella rhizosphaerae]|uniref:Uncharacterized protein n=1 Tax=Brucella rhizosphaerae TaxID=571254 RepID=A0A256F5Q4_9HYPH|nr:hypothetical protein CEV32_2616 [Brucella rhizosphaerae]